MGDLSEDPEVSQVGDDGSLEQNGTSAPDDFFFFKVSLIGFPNGLNVEFQRKKSGLSL